MQKRIGVSRAVHLIDAENLVGASLLSANDVRRLCGAYLTAVPFGPFDQVILASSHASVLALQMGWPGARYKMKSGKDGADICLAEVVVEEHLEERFEHVYFGSGDGGLAPFAAHLESRGVHVTAVSRLRSLSPKMRLATTNVVFIDRPDIAVLRCA